jgi:hypothetical protein
MSENSIISFDDFTKVKMCAGTILAASVNEKAHNPAIF